MKMKIASSASAWNPNDTTTEVPAFKAARSLKFEASMQAEAEFLARLHGCFHRGDPHPELVELVNQIYFDSTEPQVNMYDGL